MEHVYRPRNYRRITQSEACRIQGFPDNFILPPTRPRWMKLIGNSVAVPVIKILANAVVSTGVFDEKDDVDAAREKKTVVVRHKQLDFFATFRQYPENIVENTVPEHPQEKPQEQEPDVDMDKNVLISLVKNDNVERYLDQSAKIYYTGKKFPSSVALNKLYYFMPYIKKKGIRDLYLIKTARVGTRKEGQPDKDPNDFRLVFEIEFVKKLFKDYKPVELEIWHTFTGTNLRAILVL